MASAQGETESDAAWATVEISAPPRIVADLLDDPILLLRLNPCLEFDRLERLDSSSGKALHMAARNESNGCRVDTGVVVVEEPERSCVALRYLAGVKRESRFQLESLAGGSRLTITEVYSPPPEGSAEAHLAEVDRSLIPWTAAIRRHSERQARFGFLPGFRWLTRRFWPSMSPQHRRIAWLIIWTSAVEFVIFAAVLAVYLSAGK